MLLTTRKTLFLEAWTVILPTSFTQRWSYQFSFILCLADSNFCLTALYTFGPRTVHNLPMLKMLFFAPAPRFICLIITHRVIPFPSHSRSPQTKLELWDTNAVRVSFSRNDANRRWRLSNVNAPWEIHNRNSLWFLNVVWGGKCRVNYEDEDVVFKVNSEGLTAEMVSKKSGGGDSGWQADHLFRKSSALL